jgi:membrane-associated phospholipid phosphatase
MLSWPTLWPLVGFGALLVAVQARLTVPADMTIVAFVQQVQDCRLVYLTDWASWAFSGEATVVLCGLLSFVLYRRGFGWLSLVPWVIVLSVPIEFVSKQLVAQPHVPQLQWPASAGCALGYGLLEVRTIGTFPSGHSIRMGYFAVLFLLAVRVGSAAWIARVGTAMVVLFLIWSRVYRSAHWPSDVVGGVLLGTFLAFVAAHLLSGSKVPRPEVRDPQTSAQRR